MRYLYALKNIFIVCVIMVAAVVVHHRKRTRYLKKISDKSFSI